MQLQLAIAIMGNLTFFGHKLRNGMGIMSKEIIYDPQKLAKITHNTGDSKTIADFNPIMG